MANRLSGLREKQFLRGNTWIHLVGIYLATRRNHFLIAEELGKT